jgi:hypothetical protein
MKVRQASFALRVVRRRSGDAAILYRRSVDANQKERLTRVTSISPLAFSAGSPLLRSAIRAVNGANTKLTAGPYHPMDTDWGARVACYALIASGLRNADRLHHAAAAGGPSAHCAFWRRR